MTTPNPNPCNSKRRILYHVLLTALVTWIGAWVYHVNNQPAKEEVITLLFDDFDCRGFTIFTDPTLDEFDHNFAVRIYSDGPQALRLPPNWGHVSFWDLDGNGAIKTELQVGSFGVGEERVTYSRLALGAQLPCGREELLDYLLRATFDEFATAIVVQPRISFQQLESE